MERVSTLLEGIKPVTFTNSNALDDWKRFKQRIQWVINGQAKPTAKQKVAILMSRIGDEGGDIFNTFDLPEEPTYEAVIEAFDNYVQLRKNTIFERYQFLTSKQQSGQSIDAFILQLKKQANKCEFHENDKNSLIRDVLVIGINDKDAREKMLRNPQLDLDKAVTFCKIWERAKMESNILSKEAPSEPSPVVVDRIERVAEPKPARFQPPYQQSCNRCGFQHSSFDSCPANGKACNYCHKLNHFSSVCRRKQPSNMRNQPSRIPPMTKKATDSVTVPDQLYTYSTDTVRVSDEDEVQVLKICSIESDADMRKKPRRRWYVNLLLLNQKVRFKVDTGAECNTLSQEWYEKLVPRPVLLPTRVVLKSYLSKDLIRPLGKIVISYTEELSFEYYVIASEDKVDNLLSLDTAEDLGLVRITSEVSIAQQHSELFKGLGRLPGTCSLELDMSVKPHIARRRRFAQSVLPRLKQALLAMEKLEVIEKVSRPTEWVSNILVVEKNNRKRDLRICLDPKELNKAIKIPKFEIPRTDELISQLTNKKVFTVLDMSNGFWHIVLDDKSADATTFQSPFGRYRFKRMCFGLSSAPEIFMLKVAEIFGDIDGCLPYFDDLIIAAETDKEHDEVLEKVFNRARQFNIRFNVDKMQYKKEAVRFLGMIVSGAGVQVDPERIKAITQFQQPRDQKAVLRFLGMIKYLSSFIPNVAIKTEALRKAARPALAKEFQWTDELEQEFQQLKRLLVGAPVLQYFDSTLPILIQTDSSKSGIGCCLLQEGKPVAYASRALTKTEQHYSQIEKELLAIVYAVEKFHYFVYGHMVTVQSDHKPLESILKKPFDKISARLQRLCLRLLKYNIDVQYTPGTQMFVADALSRAYIKDVPEADLVQEFCVHAQTTVVASPKKKALLVQETLNDPILGQLLQYVRNGWPTAKSKIGPELSRFWNLQHDITELGNLLFYENRLMIPASCKKQILQLLHGGHMNVQKMKQLARSAVFWFGLTADIDELVATCPICLQYQRNNAKEPLQSLPLTTRPWERISCDIMHEKGSDYLVVYDTYSYWLEVLSLKSKSAMAIIQKLKGLFSVYGIPEVLVADNNPLNCPEFIKFAEAWDFHVIFTSPRYSQANGFAEKGVSIAKTLVMKNEDLEAALLHYRAAPIPHVGCSPAQLFFNRRIRSRIPVHSAYLESAVPNSECVMQTKQQLQTQAAELYNRGAKPLPALTPGEEVLIKRKLEDRSWKKGEVISTTAEPRSYIVREESGAVLRRNRRFLRPVVKPPRRLIQEI